MPKALKRRIQFSGVVDPRLDLLIQFSIFISLQNHGSFFGIGHDVREGIRPRMSRIHSPETIYSQLDRFGITISCKKPSFSHNFTLPEPFQKEFERIKRNILSDIICAFCRYRLLNDTFLISGTPAKVEYGLMRPAYIELKFRDSATLRAVLSLLDPPERVQTEK